MVPTLACWQYLIATKRGRSLRALSVNGTWNVEVQYEVASARHRLVLTTDGNRIAGTHHGWACQGDLKGEVDGEQIKVRSTLPADGNVLNFVFTGAVTGQDIAGDVRIGEYGSAKWRARRFDSIG